MIQVTTTTTLPNAKRNAIVVAAGIICHANDCTQKATRWSNLCGLCERQYLEDMKPVFGKPSKEQSLAAQKLLKAHYEKQISNGVLDDWCSQISRSFARRIGMLVSPSGMRRYETSTARYTPLLALRTRDRGQLTRRGVIALLGYALVIDALITPLIPQPVRQDYMIALLGQRFMGREVYSKATLRYRTRRVKTGVVRYGPNGPEELEQRIEEEVKEREFYRIKRADMRYIGRRLWRAMEATLLSGGRSGTEWRTLQDSLVLVLAERTERQA